MKALKSNFYLIRIDDTPVYTGYTNRSIKTRFREHLNDKDFGDGNVTVEELDSLSFPFTWDINVINQYAQEVSDRETSLIAEYGTGDSVWQKGINGNIGGQVWNDVKNFVRTNRDNPKFTGMNEADVVELIAYQKKVKHELQSVIGHTIPSETRRLKSVIGSTMSSETRRLKSVIGGTMPAEHVRLQHIIGNTIPKETRRLKSVIGHTIPRETRRLQNVIGSTIPRETRRLQNVISTTIPKETRRLKDIIGHTRTSKKN